MLPGDPITVVWQSGRPEAKHIRLEPAEVLHVLHDIGTMRVCLEIDAHTMTDIVTIAAEGTQWIHGHHTLDSSEGRALMAANLLVTSAVLD